MNIHDPTLRQIAAASGMTPEEFREEAARQLVTRLDRDLGPWSASNLSPAHREAIEEASFTVEEFLATAAARAHVQLSKTGLQVAHALGIPSADFARQGAEIEARERDAQRSDASRAQVAAAMGLSLEELDEHEAAMRADGRIGGESAAPPVRERERGAERPDASRAQVAAAMGFSLEELDEHEAAMRADGRLADEGSAPAAEPERDAHRRRAPAPPPTPSPERPGPAPEPAPAREPNLPPGLVELFAVDFRAAGAPAEGALPVPEWVHICPAGEIDEEGRRIVRGRDGRAFEVRDPSAIVERTEVPMQFDWDHESVSLFGTTRAAGWVDRVEFLEKGDDTRPEPGFWAHVERWTPKGRADVEQGYFRGLSPVCRYQRQEPDEEGGEAPPPLLFGFVNVALTNRPNLRMKMLHRADE